MKAIDQPFTKIINGTTQFVIPVFQRDYSWTEVQCEQLWHDVMRVSDGSDGTGDPADAAISGETTHFLGSVVYAPTGDSSAGFTRWLLIDGQQRMTTLMLLLAALRDHIRESQWEGGEEDITAEQIDAYFLRNLQERGSRRRKLVLRRFDQDTLAAVVDGAGLPEPCSDRIRENYETKQEKADQVYRAFRDFFPKLQAELGGVEAALTEMRRMATYYAAFTTGASSDPTLSGRLARLRRLVDVPAILVMRLFECHGRIGTLSGVAFMEALSLLESYVFRRAICGLQTRAYWQVFANMAYRISDDSPLEDLKVALASQGDSYRFPDDEEFRVGLMERDLYGLRVCRFLLETLENHQSKEPTDTSSYSIEHVLPQNEKVPRDWREMLGPDWRQIHTTWVHRLGNLTLTGYNSTYSDRSFADKKKIEGGFAESAVRLNRFIREQPTWTEQTMRQRTEHLASRAITIWQSLHVEPELIAAARQRELEELAERHPTSSVKMSDRAQELFSALSKKVRGLDTDVIEVAEKRSVSYYQGAEFFLEVLPRKHKLTLLLPMAFHEIDDAHGMAEDATQWKFIVHAQHEGGVSVAIR